ncbi:MAG: hypothetical protein NTX87_09590 [Planctomycetota bacterium]|nr:hypothetical protein [Planctomycetota bacterium]
MQHEQIWRDVIHVHQHVKRLMLQGEELDLEQNTFIQPIRELRDALEHIMRVLAAERKLGQDSGDEYIEANLQKALGHEYRAFFDVADWVSIEVRGKIRSLVEPFSPECLMAVVPDYYSTYRTEIEQTSLDIAAIRDGKDAGNRERILDQVESYRKKLDRMIEIALILERKLPAMLEYKQKESRASLRKSVAEIVIAVVAGVILIGIGWLLGQYFGCPSLSTP